ncbi:hypothetical protein [Roseimaritima sediminicola]|uniref:hypothetical protein n=1 Tax=Roseimaritima sediminicola TaxID=2662066 RepID=UPI0012982D2C|nr:hypothetical protein [Roseimaritima sediminicola]
MLDVSLTRVLGIALVVLLPASLGYGADDSSRPCGPAAMRGPLRYLIPQGAGGADFRPACRRHDACYTIPGASRQQCDRQFLRDMQCACDNSRHPIRCRITARLMYMATRLGAEDAYELSQIQVLGRLRRGR